MITVTKLKFLFFFLVVFIVYSGLAFADDPIGGPYVPDEHTVLLMHFDDETDLLKNEATVAGAVDGEARGALIALPSGLGLRPELGGALYIPNDTNSDTNHVIVPDYNALDLEGNITIEGWMQPVTYVACCGAWDQRQPSIVRKGIGNQNGNENNYQVLFSGYGHNLLSMTSYTTGDWISAASPAGGVELYNWYHFAMIRDTASATISMLVHDVDGNLLSATTANDNYMQQGLQLETNDYPLMISGNPNWNDAVGFYNGYVDELRISNIVRSYSIPLGITQVIGENVEPGETPTVYAYIKAVTGNEIAGDPILHYSTDNGMSFQTSAMLATGEPNEYSADLPTGAFGDKILYYVSVENTNGQRTISPLGAEDAVAPGYYGLGFWNREDKVLHLSFEEGSGTPLDATPYNNPVILQGLANEYSTDVPPALADSSAYSMAINMDLNVNEPDTCFVEVPAPMVFTNGDNRKGWTIDLWAKAHGRDFSSRTGQIWIWGQNSGVGNLRYANYGANEFWLGVSTTLTGDEHVVVSAPSDLMDRWFHFIGTATETAAYLWVYDENDSLLNDGVTYFDEAMDQRLTPASSGTFRLGYTSEESDILRGFVDEVKFYNYPAFLDTSEEVIGGELITNGEFDDAFTGWFQAEYGGAEVDFEIDATGSMSGPNAAHVTVTNSTGTDWNAQLQQTFRVREGGTYVMSYQARASEPCTIKSGIQEAHDPYSKFYIETNKDLTTENQTFIDTCVADINDNVQLVLMFGHVGNIELWFDAVSIMEYVEGEEPEPESPEQVDNGEFDDGFTGWSQEVHSGDATVAFSIDNTGQISGENSALIDISKATGTLWHIQLAYLIDVEANNKYIINYKAKADRDVTIETWIQQNHDPYGGYAQETINLTTEVQSFSDTANVDTDDNTKFTFMVGGSEAKIWIDAVSVIKAPEMITNGEFDDGLNGWETPVYGGAAEFSVDATGLISGPNSGHVKITESSGTNWHIQLRQSMDMVAGKIYSINYKAMASEPVSIEAWVQMNHDPYGGYLQTNVSLTPEVQEYSHIVTMDVDDFVVFSWFLGAIGTVDVWFDAVSILEVDEITGIASPASDLPEKFELSQNYPNPFNPATKINFALPVNEHVTITIYDILGRETLRLIDKPLQAGYHTIEWNGTNKYGAQVASGVYFFRLSTKSGNFNKINKMVLVR